MFNRPLPAPARDVALLIGRVVLGIVLFAHGWQKLMINGIAGTYGQFEKLGIPLAIVSASFTSFVEFVGGVLLIVGALTTTVVALDLVVMVGAAGFVHITHGIFAQDGGWELVGVIVAAELALAATGPGRFSLDHLISSYRSREQAAIERSQAPVHRAEAAGAGTFAAAVRQAPGRTPQHVGSGRVGSSQPMARYVGAGQVIGRTRVVEQPRTAEQAWSQGSRSARTPVAESLRTGEQPRVVERSPDSVPQEADQSPTTALPVVSAQADPAEQSRPVEEHWMAEESRLAEQASAYEPPTGFQPAALYDPAPMFDPARRFDQPQRIDQARRFDQVQRFDQARQLDQGSQLDRARPLDQGRQVDQARPLDPDRQLDQDLRLDRAQPASGTPAPDPRQPVGSRTDVPRQADGSGDTIVEVPASADAAPDLAADIAAALTAAQPRQTEPPRPSSDLPQRAARSERVRMAATPFQ